MKVYNAFLNILHSVYYSLLSSPHLLDSNGTLMDLQKKKKKKKNHTLVKDSVIIFQSGNMAV